MSQEWLSVVGLSLDIIGFLLIAFEWHHMFIRDVYMRQKRIERDHAKWRAEMDGDEFDDDGSIPSEAKVLRRIPPGRFVEDRDGPRPQSDNFSNSPDGTGTSVTILAEGIDPRELLEGHDGFGLVSLSVQDIRDAGLGIVRKPIVGGDQNHAHIQGKKKKKIERQLAGAAEWIVMPEPD